MSVNGQGGYRRPRRGRIRWHRRARRLLLLAAAGCLVAAAWLLISYLQQAAQTRQLQAELRTQLAQASAAPTQIPAAELQPTAAPLAAEIPVVTPYPLPTQGAPVLPKLAAILQRNLDLVGWLKSDAIEYIDFPIVQRDNSYYVYRDYNRRENRAGTVFLDQDNQMLPQDQNLILHGHNMKNGTMFGKLARLMDRQTLVKHPFFAFSSLYEEREYVPYAVSLVSINPAKPHYVDFTAHNFEASDVLDSYVSTLKAHSVLQLPVEVTPEDRLLTLVTCHGNEDEDRLIVALRALRPDEDKDTVRSLLEQQVLSRR